MLTKENIEKLKEEWYSSKDIDNIIKWLQDLENWNTLSEEEFWSSVYSEINNSLKEYKIFKSCKIKLTWNSKIYSSR